MNKMRRERYVATGDQLYFLTNLRRDLENENNES